MVLTDGVCDRDGAANGDWEKLVMGFVRVKTKGFLERLETRGHLKLKGDRSEFTFLARAGATG